MKKLIVLAGLCFAATAAIPVASASAYTGACTLEGTATIYKSGSFTEPEALPPLTAGPKPRNYKFVMEGTPACVPAATAEKAEVEGHGQLACSASNGLEVTGLAEATATLKVNGDEDSAPFSFVGVGPNVHFVAGAPGTEVFGGGAATFATDEAALFGCVAGTAKELHFVAGLAGSFS